MSTDIKFNVIIPTRERADVLVHCLRTVVAQDYQNLNIIVSDNFSQDHTRDVVTSFSDDRIQYINTGSRLSMSHNWEFALNHVTDGWVMFLGDDDGLYPWALQTLNTLIQAHDVEAVSSVFGFFQWPGHFSNSLQGKLAIPLSDSASVKSSRTELERVFSGKSIYQNLPWLYNGGAASLALINRARDQNGRFFCSQIPDLYSAIALSSFTDKYLSNRTPIAIAGVSKHSTGTAHWHSSPGEEDQPMSRFKSEQNIPFHQTLILGKSLQVMLYECYLQSWHLHHGDLGISLNDQLQVAMKTAPLAQLKTIREECRMIAEKNGLSFVDHGISWRHKFKRFPSTVKQEWLNLKGEPMRLGILNVYDATVASAYIYKFMRQSALRCSFSLATNIIGIVMTKIRSVSGQIWRTEKVTR